MRKNIKMVFKFKDIKVYEIINKSFIDFIKSHIQNPTIIFNYVNKKTHRALFFNNDKWIIKYDNYYAYLEYYGTYKGFMKKTPCLIIDLVLRGDKITIYTNGKGYEGEMIEFSVIDTNNKIKR